VQAGLGMIYALGQLTTRLEQERGVHLAARLGIHTGLCTSPPQHLENALQAIKDMLDRGNGH
jgi:hypothetical protein